MSLSNYQENKVLDHVYGGPDFTRPATVYVSLHFANPGETGANEITAITRRAVTNNSTNFPAASNGSKALSATLNFGPTTGNTTIANATHIAIWDASTGGNLLDYGAFDAQVVLADRANIFVNGGSLIITRD
jgi:hypothetical protein